MNHAVSQDDSLSGVVLDGLWDFGDPAASESRLRQARESASGAARAELTTQVARAIGLQGRYDDALAELGTVAHSLTPVVRARYALERGRVENSRGHAAEAVPWFQDGLAVARTAGDDFLEIDALHMLAIADVSAPSDWTARGLDRVAATTDSRAQRWAGSLHNNRGWALHDAGDYESAIADFEDALESYERQGTEAQVHAAKWSIARCLRSLGRTDEALRIQETLAIAAPDDQYVQDELTILRSTAG